MQIGDASLAALAGQVYLEELTLDGCRRITDEGLQHLSGNDTSLTGPPSAMPWLELGRRGMPVQDFDNAEHGTKSALLLPHYPDRTFLACYGSSPYLPTSSRSKYPLTIE